jgi:hypothetical protein
MKKLISESEKNEIRNLYNSTKVGGFDTKTIKSTLNEEQNKIRKLMRLPLLMETWNPSNAFKEVDCLKGLSKGMENLTGAVDDFVKNLGDYSSTLASKGIRTADDLYNAAVKWQTENIASLKNKLDDAALIDRYLVNTGAIKELEQSLINKTVKGIENKTMSALQDLEDEIIQDTSRLSGDELDIVGGLRSEASVGDDLSKEALEQNKVKIGEAETKIDDINRGIDKKINDLTPEGGRIADTSTEATIKALKRIKAELNNVKIALQKQKETVQSAIDQLIKKEEKESTSITWNGKSYEAVSLSKIQKALIKIGVDEFAPFIYKVVSFIVRAFRWRSLGEELVGQLAKIKELTVLSRTADPKVYKQQMDEMVVQLRNTMESLNGKYFNLTKPKSGMDLVKEFVGVGGNELETTWKEIVSILESEVTKGNMTRDEMVKILNDIKGVYGQVDSAGARISADDVNALSGLKIFRTDLEDMGKQLGVKFENNFDEAIVREAGEVSWYKGAGKWMKNTWRELTGAGFKSAILDFLSGTVKVFFRWFAYGLPFNLRSYFKPIALYGFNLKSTMMVVSRLAIGKFVGTFLFGGAFAVVNEWYRKAVYMGIEYDYTAEMAEKDAWAEWNKEMEAYSNFEFGAIIGDIFKTQNTDEMSTRPISDEEYVSNATRQYGPLTFKWREVYVEFNSFIGASPTREKVDEYTAEKKREQERKLQEGVERELKEKEQLYYSLPPEQRDEASGVATITWALDNNSDTFSGVDNTTKALIKERLFTAVDFIGNDFPDLNNTQAVEEVYLSLSNYKGFPCVCRKPLTYEEKVIRVGTSTRKVNVPECNNYVRLVSLETSNFTDGGDIYKDRQDLKPYLHTRGFVTGASATSGVPLIDDWHPITQIKQYLK